MMICLVMLAPTVCAEDAVGEAYGEFADSIPRDVADGLPDGLLSDDMDEVTRAVTETVDFRWLMTRLAEAVGADLGGALSFGARLLGLLVLSALLSSVRGTFGSEAAGRAVDDIP